MPSEFLFSYALAHSHASWLRTYTCDEVVSVEAMVRGYHVHLQGYIPSCDAVVGEECPCKCEDGNRVKV